MTENVNEKYEKVAEIINRAGEFSYPITDTLIEILKYNINEENLDLVLGFTNQISQTMEQLIKNTGLSENQILKKAELLAKKGVIFNQPNRQGVIVYRLLPVARQFEYTFMKKLEDSPEFRTLANLYHKLDKEIGAIIQTNYKTIVSNLDKRLPIDRTVLTSFINKETGKEIEINEKIESPTESVLPSQRVEEIINKYEDIAVGNCFCRQHKDLLGDPCKQTEIRENCFTLGKSARHTAKQGFSRLISKEEALEIIRATREDGLVHKAYHLHSDITKEEVAICNCCSCCCLNSRNLMVGPIVNANNYLAKVKVDECIGCENCVHNCHNSAISLNDENIAEVNEEYCIGCGVCAYFCPENAILMIEGPRVVRMIPPRRIEKIN
ncbi:MAG: 4Fe-4S dicluster-binding protein [Candidatus Hodarchaeota archaeon]